MLLNEINIFCNKHLLETLFMFFYNKFVYFEDDQLEYFVLMSCV